MTAGKQLSSTNRSRTVPLLDLFLELRNEQFPLGIGECSLAIKALAQGFGTGSREELIFMCQTIWAKTIEDQVNVRRTLERLLPKRLSLEELEQLQQQSKEVVEGNPIDEDFKRRIDEMLLTSPTKRRPRPAPMASDPLPGLDPQPASGLVLTRPLVATGAGAMSIALDSSVRTRSFDLVRSLPVTRRQMKQSWRSYRRPRRTGPPAELDLNATINQIHRNGVLMELVILPRRRNLARLLVILDISRSMVPFRRMTQALLDSVQHGDLGTVSVLYFNNSPSRGLFRDPQLRAQVSFVDAFKPFRKAGVLIVSDGGAARGNCDEDRARQTVTFLQSLKHFRLSLAWLNPTPEKRWPETTAGAICKGTTVPMFALDHTGLIESIEVLRGKRY